MKTPSRQYLEEILDKLIQIYVVARDGVCRKCGYTEGLCAHHIFGRGHRATRWDPEANVTHCVVCHEWADHSPKDYEAWVISWMGREKYDHLLLESNMVKKWTIDELQEIRERLAA